MLIKTTTLRPIDNIAGQTCFGCGADNPLGLQMTFRTDGQRVYSQVTVPPAMAGWDRTVHGGIVTTMLDEIMGWSVIALRHKIGVTKSITVDFKKPVPVEEELTVIGAIQELSSERQVLVSGEIFCAEGIVCATALGTFAAMSARTAVRLGVMSTAYMERFLPLLEQTGGD